MHLSVRTVVHRSRISSDLPASVHTASNKFEEIQDPDTKQLEEEAALGIDLLRQMKDLNKTHEKFNPEESLVKQAENLYFDSGMERSQNLPEMRLSELQDIKILPYLWNKFTDESSEQSLRHNRRRFR